MFKGLAFLSFESSLHRRLWEDFYPYYIGALRRSG